jgi:predicted nucleic acid-binding protein
VLYLDTAALVKLVRPEPESAALADYLDARQETILVSSALVEVELPRALRRSEPALIGRVPGVLARLGRYDIDETVRQAAGSYPETTLRSLDAIHLATADVIFRAFLEAFVAYDHRLRTVAAEADLPVACPGVTPEASCG